MDSSPCGVLSVNQLDKYIMSDNRYSQLTVCVVRRSAAQSLTSPTTSFDDVISGEARDCSSCYDDTTHPVGCWHQQALLFYRRVNSGVLDHHRCKLSLLSTSSSSLSAPEQHHEHHAITSAAYNCPFIRGTATALLVERTTLTFVTSEFQIKRFQRPSSLYISHRNIHESLTLYPES